MTNFYVILTECIHVALHLLQFSQSNVDAELKKQEEKKVIPHFWNLHEDPALTAMIVHFTREGMCALLNI